jgi:uncharacterized repeat protein (TIGR01451 family)
MHTPTLRLNPLRALPISFALILNAILGPLAPLANQAFTNAANDGIDDYAQCQIGNPRPAGLDCQLWTNGILNATHNQYTEDEVVPQRLLLNFGSAGAHSVRISYLARKDSGTIQHAYDSLATWNHTYTGADRCQTPTATVCLPGPATTFPIPSDSTSVPPGGPQPTSAHELAQAARQFVMYGGTITSTSAITHDTAPAATGDDYASITVSFNATRSDGQVQLLFGGHLAAGFGLRGWGAGLGAANINGGPYHIRITAVDAAAIGNRDNQIMSNAIAPVPGLALSKTTSTPVITAGDPASYTINLANDGDGDATGVVITDTLPTGVTWTENSASCSISGGVLTCGPMTIAAHTTFSVTVTGVTDAGDCPSLSNTVSYTSTNGGSGSTAASPTVITVNCPVLKITKIADDTSVDAGNPVGFTVEVTNLGPGIAKNVTLDDPLPGASGVDWSISPAYAGPGTCLVTGNAPTQTLSCSFGNMAVNDSASVHVTSATGNQTCATLANTATASADNAADIDASASISVSCHPDVGVEKSTSTPVVSAGELVSYDLTVTAGGTGNSTNVVLSDQLPAGIDWSSSGPDAGACATDANGLLTCNFGTMAPGDEKHVTVSGTSDADDCPGVDNTATVSSDADSDSANNSAGPVAITVNCPDLTASKTADNGTVSGGEQIGFTIDIVNKGSGDAFNVALNDPLPAGADLDWTIADQPAGDPCSITGNVGAQTLECSFGTLASGTGVAVHVVSDTTAADCSTLHNVAHVTASNNEPLNPQADVTIQCPGLNVAKTAATSPIHGGDTASFTVSVWNVGPGSALNAILNDPLPAGESGVLDWSIDPAYSGPGTCDVTGAAGGQTLTCSFGDLPAGTTKANPSASITLVAVTSPADECATLDNTATVSADNNPSRSASASIEVTCPALVIEKSVDKTVIDVSEGTSKADHTTTWTLSYALTDGPVSNAQIVDTIPAGLTYVTGSASVAPSSINGQVLTWDFPLLSSSGTITFKTTVDDNIGGGVTLTNVVTIESDQTPKDDGQAKVKTVETAPPQEANPSVPNTALALDQNGRPIQIPVELMVLFFLSSLAGLTFANVRSVRRRRS